jgi:hypothetical protein
VATLSGSRVLLCMQFRARRELIHPKFAGTIKLNYS